MSSREFYKLSQTLVNQTTDLHGFQILHIENVSLNNKNKSTIGNEGRTEIT